MLERGSFCMKLQLSVKFRLPKNLSVLLLLVSWVMRKMEMLNVMMNSLAIFKYAAASRKRMSYWWGILARPALWEARDLSICTAESTCTPLQAQLMHLKPALPWTAATAAYNIQCCWHDRSIGYIGNKFLKIGRVNAKLDTKIERPRWSYLTLSSIINEHNETPFAVLLKVCIALTYVQLRSCVPQTVFLKAEFSHRPVDSWAQVQSRKSVSPHLIVHAI